MGLPTWMVDFYGKFVGTYFFCPMEHFQGLFALKIGANMMQFDEKWDFFLGMVYQIGQRRDREFKWPGSEIEWQRSRWCCSHMDVSKYRGTQNGWFIIYNGKPY